MPDAARVHDATPFPGLVGSGTDWQYIKLLSGDRCNIGTQTYPANPSTTPTWTQIALGVLGMTYCVFVAIHVSVGPGVGGGSDVGVGPEVGVEPDVGVGPDVGPDDLTG